MLAPALAERLTLVLNHVLGAEAVATDKLRPHAGRRLVLTLANWPSLLPAPPVLAWRVTPAGLLEWSAESSESGTVPPPSDLSVTVEMSNPALVFAQALGGTPPVVQIDGDAQLAGDVNWLIQNLRWDVAADLERLFGPTVGPQLHKVGSALAKGLRGAAGFAADMAAKGAAQFGEKLRPRGP